MHRAASSSCVAVVVAIAACNDGLEASTYEGRCQTPPPDIVGDVPPEQPGTLRDEQLWVRAWMGDTYLWYTEIPRADPKQFATAVDYFNVLKTRAITASGKPKDQFHFSYPTEVWDQMSRSGVEVSYGVRWVASSAQLKGPPPRELNVVAAYVEPSSPAASAGIQRGARVLAVDGVDLVNGEDGDTLYEGLFPSAPDRMHTLVIQDVAATAPRTVALTSTPVVFTPVQGVALASPHERVGYLAFHAHVGSAYRALIAEIGAMRDRGVTDLVLDMRYNNGGYLTLAAALAYMIAGPTAIAGRPFYQLHFNDKHLTVDPVTHALITPIPFASLGETLPNLDLPRVFVLTGRGTCSASEAVMNGLAGVDVQVIQIGTTTCGKPYGFYPTSNCGTTYFAVQFSATNAKGFGDYADGFRPGHHYVGCEVADDFAHELGDPAEARLAAALEYMTTGACPAVARSTSPTPVIDDVASTPLWLQNAVLMR